MAKGTEDFRPSSLLQYFQAPDGYSGCFGWLCGYSADVDFMAGAIERFSGRTKSQLEVEGKFYMAMMLDPGNEQLSPVAVPGLAHLGILDLDKKPFALLHAKVALLGFQSENSADEFVLRLIVSTGNWTRATVESSLDLVWAVDVTSEEIREKDDGVRQACADIRAAWEFLSWLTGLFNFQLLRSAPMPEETNVLEDLRNETANGAGRLLSWIASASAIATSRKPRFFDNRARSLLAQLPRMVGRLESVVRRNYLAFGSGFYEGGRDKNRVPAVLSKILDKLIEDGLLTKSPELDVFVNPVRCQCIASAVDALNGAGYTVRPAGVPGYFGPHAGRSLHAKFLFSAGRKADGSKLSSAWLYLGSGNLTNPGFASSMSANNGNLEAGVVFEPGELYLRRERGVPVEKIVTNVLPVQFEEDVDGDDIRLSDGGEMEVRETVYVAPPVSHFIWAEGEQFAKLKPAEKSTLRYFLVSIEGKALLPDEDGCVEWQGERPRQVLAKWNDGARVHEQWVSVKDEFGRVSSTAPAKITLEEAWFQLANFPQAGEFAEDEECGSDHDQFTSSQKTAGDSVQASYPIRTMMQLVEDIASRQVEISKTEWLTWCNRLNQALSDASDSAELKSFKSLGLNPLSPLWHKPFRPEFAEDNQSPEGAKYEEVLRAVEERWQVQDFVRLGGNS